MSTLNPELRAFVQAVKDLAGGMLDAAIGGELPEDRARGEPSAVIAAADALLAAEGTEECGNVNSGWMCGKKRGHDGDCEKPLLSTTASAHPRRKFADLRAQMSPESQERVAQRVADALGSLAASPAPATRTIYINRTAYPVTLEFATGAALRNMPTPAVPDDHDLWAINPIGDDFLDDFIVGHATHVQLRDGTRFYTAPQHINAGSPAPADPAPMRIDLFVDGETYEWRKSTIAGAELRSLAGIPQDVRIFLKVPGKPDRPIGDQTVTELVERHGLAHFSTQASGSQAGEAPADPTGGDELEMLMHELKLCGISGEMRHAIHAEVQRREAAAHDIGFRRGLAELHPDQQRGQP